MLLIELYNLLILSVFAFSLFIASKNFKISFLSPAMFFGIFWFFISSLAFLNSKVFPISPTTLLFLVTSFLMLLIPDVLLSRRIFKHKKRFHFKWNKSIIIFGFFTGLLAVLVLVLSHGISLKSLLSPSKIILLSNEAYASKIKGEMSKPLLYTILISGFYSTCIFAGIQFSNNHKKNKISFIPFIIGVLIMLIETSKAAFLYTTILWISGYFAANVFFGNKTLFTNKVVKIFTRFFIAILILFLISSINRYNLSFDSRQNILSIILMKAQIYFFGGLGSFNDWFINVYSFNMNEMGFGKYTFGLFEKEKGVFRDFTTFENGYRTNIYTYFRHLVVDFGIFGSLIFHLCLGFILSLIYKLVQSGWKTLIPLLAFSYTFILWSFIISISVYKTVIFAIVLSLILMFISQLNSEKK